MPTSIQLSILAQQLGAQLDLKGAPDSVVSGIAPLDVAGKTEISFLSNAKYAPQLKHTQAAAVMVTAEHAAESTVPVLIMTNPYLGFAKVAALFDPTPVAKIGVSKSAVIDPSVTIPASASIGEKVVIEAGVSIGEHVIIGHGCVIGARSALGDHSCLKANVTLYHDVKMGKRCMIHSGAVIGSDGFGNVQHQGRWIKIPQLGTVVIGDDVEVGANTTIDRGALGNTEIHTGAKLDNLIQVAHNVKIGEHTAIAANTGIAGSTTIGKHCMIGGAVGISGHLHIADRVMITAMSGISKSLDQPGVYSSGIPAKEQKVWARQLGYFSRLSKYVARIQQLEQQLAALTTSEPEPELGSEDGH